MSKLLHVEFECRVITPMFLAGADQNKPEIRAPSIRGQMRWWFRAVCGSLCGGDHTKVAKYESQLFGGTDEEASQSQITFRALRTERFSLGTAKPVPRKSFIFHAIEPSSRFKVILFSTPSGSRNSLETAHAVFELFALLGGLGRRSRRGFGSFQPSSWRFENKREVEEFIKQKVIHGADRTKQFTLLNSDSLSEIPTQFPILSEKSTVIHVGEPDNWNSVVNKLMTQIHSGLQSGTLSPNVLGNANPRQGSTMLISVIGLTDSQIVPVFTNFLTDTYAKPIRKDFDSIIEFPKRVFGANRIFGYDA